MMNMQMTPDTAHDATPAEVRQSMLAWFGQMMPDATVDQWKTFKAHLYPAPVVHPEPVVDTEPDYEAQHEARMEATYPER